MDFSSNNNLSYKKGDNKEITSFCKTHNILCSIDSTKESGNHYNCEVCDISEIKDSKLNDLKKNLNIIEDFVNSLGNSMDDLKKMIEENISDKEKLMKEIQEFFTKIRNELNYREDLLLLEIDKLYDIYTDKKIMRKIEKLPKNSKKNLEKGKSINIDKNSLNSIINDCLDIENNIKEIEEFNKLSKKFEQSKNIQIKFYKNLEFLQQGIKNLRIESLKSNKRYHEITLLFRNENRLIEIEADLENKIKEIKPKICQNILSKDIKLFNPDGDIINDEDFFFGFNFAFLYIDYKINITIKYNGTSKITFKNINIMNSLEYIMNKIDFNIHINKSEQRLLYKGNEIKSVLDLIKFIESKDIELDLYNGPKDRLLIDIKKNGEIYNFSFDSNTIFKDIKLYDLVGLPNGKYNIYYKGEILDQEKSLKDNNIENKSILDLDLGNIIFIRRNWIWMASYQNSIQLSHKLPFPKLIPLEVEKSETIQSIKNKFSLKDIHLPVANQKIVYNDNELEDNKSLKEYNINFGEIIDVIYKSDKIFPIFISTLTGKIIKIDANFFDTMHDIKEKIQKKEGIPICDQRFIFNGRQLEDDFTLGDYNIRENDKIFLVLRLKFNK